MKKLILISILLLFSFTASAGWFSKDKGQTKSKKISDIISVQIEEGVWVYFPKDKLVLVLDEDNGVVKIAYGNNDEPMKEYGFKSAKAAKKFIESVYPDSICLTSKGAVKCESTKQLIIEEE